MLFLYLLFFGILVGFGLLFLFDLFSLIKQDLLPKIIDGFLSYSFGIMIGVSFLDFIPIGVSEIGEEKVFQLILLTMIFIFFSEKIITHRHSHDYHYDSTHNVSGKIGKLIIVGDIFHNFIDGLIISTAFFQSFSLGIVAVVAVIVHEIPHKLSDRETMLKNGFSPEKVFNFNLLSGFGTISGTIISFFLISKISASHSYLISFSAATFIYIAIADLIPKLNKKCSAREIFFQIIFITFGFCTSLLTEIY